MSARETMNASAEKRKRSSSCMGWACRRERQRADAERVEGVAARRPWPPIGEWDPRKEDLYFGVAPALLAAAVGGGAPNCSSRMSCIAVVVESVGSRNVSAPADCIIPLTR